MRSQEATINSLAPKTKITTIGVATTVPIDIKEPGGLVVTTVAQFIILLIVEIIVPIIIITVRPFQMAMKTALTVRVLTSMQTTTALHEERTSFGRCIIMQTTVTSNTQL